MIIVLIDWYFTFVGAYGKACVKIEVDCQSLRFLTGAVLFVLQRKNALYNSMSFLPIIPLVWRGIVLAWADRRRPVHCECNNSSWIACFKW